MADEEIAVTNGVSNHNNHLSKKQKLQSFITSSEIRSEFAHHDPNIARINNGSFGSCPNSIIKAQQRKNKKAAKTHKESSHSASVHQLKQVICVEGENLVQLLKSIQREIVSARILDSVVPDKIWVKQQFSIGVNDVTRVLERMPTVVAAVDSSDSIIGSGNSNNVRLQAILLASDCYPQMLTKHLPSLASSKNVPLIYVKDKRQGSLRLGDLVKLKTAIAVGIKDRRNDINHLVENILNDQESRGLDARDAVKASNMDMHAITEMGPPEMI